MALQRTLDAHFDGRALFPLPALRRDLIDAGGTPRGGVGFLQPFVEQGLQLAHVLEAQLESLEPADRGLGEDVAVQGAESQTHVRLREAQLDASLFELFGKMFQVVGGRSVLVRVRLLVDAVVLVKV